MAFLPILGKVLGGLVGLGGAAKGAADSRMDANQQAILQDRNRLDAQQMQQNAILQALGLQERGALDRANLDLNQRSFALNAPSVRGKQALLGSLMQNLQPVSMSGLPSKVAAKMPQISGGLSAAALGPMAREFGGLMQSNAIAGQQKGDSFDPIAMPNFSASVLPQLQLSQPQKAGLFEKILGGVGLGASLISPFLPKPDDGGLPSGPSFGARGR